MAVPTLTSVSPAAGQTGGGELARIVGSGFAPNIAVHFGSRPALVVAVREDGGASLADVRTPSQEAGVVEVVLQNLDSAGIPVAGESARLVSAYRFARPALASESDLTRIVRQLLRELKVQVLGDVSATVSVDYDDTVTDGLNVIAMAKLPSLVLSGPTLRPNRFYSANVPHESVTPSGAEIVRHSPPYTVDLVFTLTAASERTAELLNLMAAVATFLNRNRWLELPRDPDDPSRGSVRWEMDADGEFRTQLEGRTDVRAFTCGLVVRGFDIDEGLPLELGRVVAAPQLDLHPFDGDAV